MKYSANEHTFVICAYKESAYLEKCILSLNKQTVKTNIIMVTSTPNEYIRSLGKKYNIPLYLNEYGIAKGSDISDDWNFALSKVTSPLATIAHQDDIYQKEYAEQILMAINKCDHPLIAFSDYSELRNAVEIKNNKLLNVKRKLLIPLRNQKHWKSVFWRRRVLSMGSPICCPAVTYCLTNLNRPIFVKGFKSDLDWQAWEKLSHQNGEFAFVNKILMSHRIHEDSTTSSLINSEGRGSEDLAMFKMFWPALIAKLIEKKYKSSEDQNALK
jgi:glycosyltransferase involved in cell wall biosynthesis